MHPLRLDHDAFVADPPRRQDRATYDGNRALCEVLASTTANGAAVGRQSTDTIAAGLARVTVNDKVLHHTQLGDVVESGSVDGVADVNPTTPPPTPYHDRLAWVVVVEYLVAVSCPLMNPTSRPTLHVEQGHHHYAVFVIDAMTGGDALRYTERMNPLCPGGYPGGPWVDVPLTSVSIPWQLVSEARDRSNARIRIEVTRCDGYLGVALADRPALALVRMVVHRPFGAPCGPAHAVVQKLRAAVIGTSLPPTLEHAPVGPYVA